jgi:octaprenyl-diphosphate synthase
MIHTARRTRPHADHATQAVEAASRRLIRPVAGPLERVVEAFDEELRSDLPAVNQLVKHVGRFRGKMLRPTLLLLAAEATRPGAAEEEAAVKLAAVVEMVHMSTLVHDDVLDEAELRRRGATINHLRGNEAAVLLGDYLISHSYHLCSGVDLDPDLPPQWAARRIGATTNRLCEGELLQNHHRGDLDLPEATYYEIVRRKTGALTAASCEIGCRVAGGDAEAGEAMYRFGELLGIAFQVQDDVLDLVGDVREVGKTLGVDAAKQKLTLPLIHFLRTAPAEHRDLLKTLLREDDPDRADKVRQLVLPSGSVAWAREQAQRITQEAAACLDDFADGPARDALVASCAAVVKRAA